MCINNNQSVDLNFDVQTGQYVHGDYTISFKNLPQFMIGSCLVLEDLHNGVVTDLRVDSSYSFTSDSLAHSPRFKLQINIDYDINVVNSTCFQDSSAIISLTGSSLQDSYFNLIDSNGLIISSIIANQDSISFDGLNAGNYYISTDHSNSCTMSNQDIIIVQPQEVTSDFLTFSDTVLLDTNGFVSVNFKNISSGATIYNWSFGDGFFSSLENPTHSYITPGSYIVQLTAFNDSLGTCFNTIQKTITVSDPFLFTPSVENINNINFSSSNGILNISSPNIFGNDLDILIYNIEGKQIYRCNLDGLFKQIDLSSVKTGIYLIKVQNNINGENKYYNKFYLK
jgi:PKD repeat protein